MPLGHAIAASCWFILAHHSFSIDSAGMATTANTAQFHELEDSLPNWDDEQPRQLQERQLAQVDESNFTWIGSKFTNFTVVASSGVSESFAATPARWNAWHPKTCSVGAGWRCACPQPAGPLTPSVSAALMPAPGLISGLVFHGLGYGCLGQVPPAPRGVAAVLVTRRGECSFREKVNAAHESGYCGLVVANLEDGAPHPFYGISELPDMSVEPDSSDAEVGIPAWIISKSSGDAIFDKLQAGMASIEAQDWAIKPAIGNAQEDRFETRDHQVE